ncbi:hypothetical protein GGR54DRAFT_286020 [Hypoxylon sp. NC1633]|nr:hypothetical protein GGR54DRAFT_286020 [Hypoxylon sp. NC1633]
MSQSSSDVHSQYTRSNLQSHGGQSGQPYTGHNDISSQSLITAPTPPLSSNANLRLAPTSLVQPSNDVVKNSRPFNEISQAEHPLWSSGTQPVPQTERFEFQLPAGGTPALLPESLPMRYVQTNLAVLSAEQYDDGRFFRRPASKANNKPNTTVVPVENTPNIKRRGRRPVNVEQTELAEETKRSRGRPRLETKDQTPTERRRTQIRLAQRAYRNRKETAITDLQAKINDLRDVNNEINNAYQNLFDFASRRGLLAQAPEFEQQLQRLQELVKNSQEEKDSPKASENDSPEETSDDAPQEVQMGEDVPAAVVTEESSAVHTQPEAETTQFWGITVSHEPEIQLEAPAPISSPDIGLDNSQLQQYEIITAPTVENASFGPDMSIDMNFLDPMQSSWAQHPWNRLTGPRTMAFNEWSFARRLHRHAVERAAVLITMPNPPPASMSRVFGFVMLFETIEEIRARTMVTLSRIRDEPLNYWEHPFHRLGGSGTHFSSQEAGPSSLAGSSTYESTGFGTGPFNERTTRVRDTMLGVSQYINMNGWEGTWFDSGEVETYLAQNGVFIPTSADIHAVELQPGAFSDVESQPQIQLMQTIPPNASINPDISNNPSPVAGDAALAGGSSLDSNIGPSSARDDAWSSISVTSNLFGAPQATGRSNPSFTGFDNMAANVFPNSSSYLFPYHQPTAETTATAPKRVVLDVNEFLNRLISHATCLGRAPAFRPKDIVSSFWASVID